MDYMASVIEKIIVERNKKVDSAILGEIQQIAVENGIETKIILNEKAVADALRKQIPKLPAVTRPYGENDCVEDYKCPTCNSRLISRIQGEWCAGRFAKYCSECGQALDWAKGE